MSNKYYFSLLAFLFIFQNSEAQERRFNAGFLLGTNASQIQGDREARYNKLGLYAGITAQILFTEKAELGLELAFSQLGSRSVSTNPGVEPFKSTLNYIMVPVYFKYKDWLMEDEQYYRLHFLGGLSYGRLFSTKMEGEPFESIDGFLRDNYFGFLIGAVYFVNSKIGIGARFERSLIDIYNNDLDNGGPPVETNIWSKHLNFFVTYSLL